MSVYLPTCYLSELCPCSHCGRVLFLQIAYHSFKHSIQHTITMHHVFTNYAHYIKILLKKSDGCIEKRDMVQVISVAFCNRPPPSSTSLGH